MVAAIGTVTAMRRQGPGGRLTVIGALPGEPLAMGESIAVNGACLSVVELQATAFTADLSPETLTRTTLGGLRSGARVNLERTLRLVDRLGGHLVLGHVDATVPVVAVRPAHEFRTLRLALPAALAAEVAEKGSVAVDGVSLTVSGLGEGWLEVALVPATLGATTLAERRAGELVNLETDVLAKYVARAMGKGRAGLERFLGEA